MNVEKDDCVSHWIKELSKAHPEWKRDQVVAVALKKCGESNQKGIFATMQETISKLRTK